MSRKKSSIDEYLSKHRSRVAKTATGTEAIFKGIAAPPSFKAEARAAGMREADRLL